MNFTYWKGELEIFDEEDCLVDRDESIFHCWQPAKDKIVFVLKAGWEVKEKDDGDGGRVFCIERVKA